MLPPRESTWVTAAAAVVTRTVAVKTVSATTTEAIRTATAATVTVTAITTPVATTGMIGIVMGTAVTGIGTGVTAEARRPAAVIHPSTEGVGATPGAPLVAVALHADGITRPRLRAYLPRMVNRVGEDVRLGCLRSPCHCKYLVWFHAETLPIGWSRDEGKRPKAQA